MSLPILQTDSTPSTETLLRLFQKTARDWTRHLGEETPLDVGTAFHNPELPKVWDANRMLDGALPPELSAGDAVDLVDAHYASHGLRCRCWMMNVSSPINHVAPLAEELLRRGHKAHVTDIMYLSRQPTTKVVEVPGLRIIPSRASFRHARELATEAAAKWNEPQLVEAWMLHLDDPHWDSLIALQGGRAVATAGVLTVGEIGLIENVFVTGKCRRLGFGRTMMSRALEICARGLLKHIFLEVFPENAAAIALYSNLGFRKIGTSTVYLAPSD